MRKKRIDQWIPKACGALSCTKIASADGTIEKNYRGQIASFGASVAMGSVLSAVAFFSDKGDSDAERPLLMNAILLVLDAQYDGSSSLDLKENESLSLYKQYGGSLFAYAKDIWKDDSSRAAFTEDVLNAAVALKLAMNLYQLVDKKPSGNKEAIA